MRPRIFGLGRSLGKAGLFLEVVAILYGLGGVIGGGFIADTSSIDANGAVRHPNVGVGVAIIAGTVVSATLYWAIARALRLFGEYSAFTLYAPLGVLADSEDEG